MIFWATSITVSVALLVITAAMKSANPSMAYAHMMIAAVMAIVFADMGFNRLISEVLTTNERVVALHERVGFVREGVLREHVRRDDGVYDVVVLSMLAEEWQARHGRRRRA
jgi:RimJ/RimL family protein N-acetyltransferase